MIATQIRSGRQEAGSEGQIQDQAQERGPVCQGCCRVRGADQSPLGESLGRLLREGAERHLVQATTPCGEDVQVMIDTIYYTTHIIPVSKHEHQTCITHIHDHHINNKHIHQGLPHHEGQVRGGAWGDLAEISRYFRWQIPDRAGHRQARGDGNILIWV